MSAPPAEAAHAHFFSIIESLCCALQSAAQALRPGSLCAARSRPRIKLPARKVQSLCLPKAVLCLRSTHAASQRALLQPGICTDSTCDACATLRCGSRIDTPLRSIECAGSFGWFLQLCTWSILARIAATCGTRTACQAGPSPCLPTPPSSPEARHPFPTVGRALGHHHR